MTRTDIIALLSLLVGILTNGLLFSTGFWVNCDLKATITLWIVVPGFVAYITFKVVEWFSSEPL